MPPLGTALLVVLAALAGLAVMLYVVRALKHEHALETVEHERAETRFRERLRNPDAAAYAARFGCRPGAALLGLMRNTDLLPPETIVRVPDREPMEVAWFLPMDAQQLAEPPRPGCEALHAFATNGAGSQYLVTPCVDDPDVLYFDHTTGRCDRLGVRLSEFVALLHHQT